MKKQTTVLLSVLLGVLLLVGIGQFLVSQQKSLSLPTSQSRSATVPTLESKSTLTVVPTQATTAITIDFGDGKIMSGKIVGKTAYEALTAFAKENNLVVEVKQYKYGKLVVKVGQKENSTSTFWTYLVNGKPGQIAGDSFLVYPGDRVEWIYKKM